MPAFLPIADAIAAAVRDDERCGPFALHLDHGSANVWRNYAVPDIGAEPTAADIDALLAAFAARDRTPRLEYVPAASPAVEPALLAAGFTVEDRPPLYACAPADRVDRPAPGGIALALAGPDDLLDVVRVQHAAYADPEPPGPAHVDRLAAYRRRGGVVALARATATGEAVAAVQCGPIAAGASELVGMAVAEAYRGRGIATALAAYVTRAVHRAGASNVWLETEPGLPTRVYGDAGYRPAGEKLWISRPAGRLSAGPVRLHPVDAARATAIASGDLGDLRAGEGWPHGQTAFLMNAVAAMGAETWLVTRDGTVIGDASILVEDVTAQYTFRVGKVHHDKDVRIAVRRTLEAEMRARPGIERFTDNSPPPADSGPPRIEAGERDTLLAFVTYLREALIAKLDGLSEADARRSTVDSGTTILGLVKHVADVELSWLSARFAGGDEPTDGDLVDGDTIASVVALARAAGARTTEIVSAAGPAAPAAIGGGLTLRWILVHLVEEIGRHAGHADILREQIDGLTGR